MAEFFKRIENAVGNGEIARYQQFLLFPQCFQKTCTAHQWATQAGHHGSGAQSVA